jgi:hypothetical protein
MGRCPPRPASYRRPGLKGRLRLPACHGRPALHPGQHPWPRARAHRRPPRAARPLLPPSGGDFPHLDPDGCRAQLSAYITSGEYLREANASVASAFEALGLMPAPARAGAAPAARAGSPNQLIVFGGWWGWRGTASRLPEHGLASRMRSAAEPVRFKARLATNRRHAPIKTARPSPRLCGTSPRPERLQPQLMNAAVRPADIDETALSNIVEFEEQQQQQQQHQQHQHQHQHQHQQRGALKGVVRGPRAEWDGRVMAGGDSPALAPTLEFYKVRGQEAPAGLPAPLQTSGAFARPLPAFLRCRCSGASAHPSLAAHPPAPLCVPARRRSAPPGTRSPSSPGAPRCACWGLLVS